MTGFDFCLVGCTLVIMLNSFSILNILEKIKKLLETKIDNQSNESEVKE